MPRQPLPSTPTGPVSSYARQRIGHEVARPSAPTRLRLTYRLAPASETLRIGGCWHRPPPWRGDRYQGDLHNNPPDRHPSPSPSPCHLPHPPPRYFPHA